jgi:hypothetical protein
MITPDAVAVNIDEISPNDFFKVSRKNYQNNLIYSLKQSGMLEVPVLVKKDSGYDIFTCHNRIQILRETGVADLKCFIIDTPECEFFINRVSLKAYRNELGLFGKLKVLSLLNNYFKADGDIIKDFCSKVLKLPLEAVGNEVYFNKILSFPGTLIDYLDEKDMSFKTIKDLSRMPEDWMDMIGRWLEDTPIRVNIFRMLADYLYDIYRRGDNIPMAEVISCSDDKTLHDVIFRIRYPEFSRLKSRADNIINDLTAGGVSVDFPEYFDGKKFTLKLEIDKRSDCDIQLKKIRDIDVEKLKDLISLL